MSDVYYLNDDLDGVTAKYEQALAEVVEEAKGLPKGSLPRSADWDFSNWGITRGEFMGFHEELVVNRNGFRHLEPMEGASEVLWRLSDAGVHIAIVTHRLLVTGQHATAASDTVSWLEDNHIPYRDLCFLGRKSAFNADLHIDDSPSNIEKLQAAGQQVLIFDQAYNRHCEGPRAANWLEVEEFVLADMERKGCS